MWLHPLISFSILSYFFLDFLVLLFFDFFAFLLTFSDLSALADLII